MAADAIPCSPPWGVILKCEVSEYMSFDRNPKPSGMSDGSGIDDRLSRAGKADDLSRRTVRRTLKRGAEAVERAVPGHDARVERKEARAYSKQRKAEYKADLKDWNMKYVEAGSAAERAHLDRLCENILGEQMDYIQFVDSGEAWESEAAAKKETDKMNREYCRNMFDYCISPLQHGVTAESVVDTLGIYVGMSLFSKDFRNMVNPEVQKLMLPIKDMLGKGGAGIRDHFVKRNLQFADFIERTAGGKRSALEHQDPPVSDIDADRSDKKGFLAKWAEKYKSNHYYGQNADAHARKMEAYRDRIEAAKNYGRVPLNPETAALQQLRIKHTYYMQLRDPEIDPDEADKNFTNARHMLGRLMKADGVQPEDMASSLRTIVGQICAAHPEYECEFSDFYLDEVVKAGLPKDIRPELDNPVGTPTSVWTGEYVQRNVIGPDGEQMPYVGDFRVRAPMDVSGPMDENGNKQKGHKELMHDYFVGLLKGHSFDEMHEILMSKPAQKALNRFAEVMETDFKYFDALDAKNGVTRDKPRDVGDVMKAVGRDVMSEVTAHDPEGFKQWQASFDEAKMEETRNKQRYKWGFDLVDGISEMEGGDYESP